jgi:hypothetical protein
MAVRQVGLVGRDTTKKRSTQKLDPNADFEEPVRTEPEQLSAEELEAENEEKREPTRIINGFMAINYVKPHFDIEKDKRSVAMEFSVELTEDHRDLLPDSVVSEWRHIEEGTCRLSEVSGVGAQSFDLRLAPDGAETELQDSAPIEKIRLQVIEDKGTGDAKDIIRLSFRLVCALNPTVERFACRHYGSTIWLKMGDVQGTLPLET